MNKHDDTLIIAEEAISSRLFVGTGKFPDDTLITPIMEQSGSKVVTVAVRRVDLDGNQKNIISAIPKNAILMPNTSGARNAEEAIRIARLAKATGCGNWIKIEVIPDHKHLLPDNYETIKATEVLANEGFVVMPYMLPDLITARHLVDAGAASIMPLGAPIGSNQGLRTKELVQILIDEIPLPIVVDAGLGKPSDACQAMEMGASACLVNTAIALAKDPVAMATAFAQAVDAGRKGYLAGVAVKQTAASASSPLTGFLHTTK